MLPACSSSAKDAKTLENMCTHPATQAGKTVHVFTQVLLYYCLLVNTLQAQRFKERRKAHNERRKAAKAEVQEAGRRKLEANQMKRQRRRTARSAQDPDGYVCDGCRMPCPKGYCVRNRNLARLHKAMPTPADATRTDTHNANHAQHHEVTDTIGCPARGYSAQASSGNTVRRAATGRNAGKQLFYSWYYGGQRKRVGGSGDDPADGGDGPKPGTMHEHKSYTQRARICKLVVPSNRVEYSGSSALIQVEYPMITRIQIPFLERQKDSLDDNLHILSIH
jgi:hypothetical protein